MKGLLSRRKTELYIKKGWIRVNGKVISELGFKITPGLDKVELDSQIYAIKSHYKYIMLYKPRGIVTNCPKPGEREIKGILPKNLRVLNTIGRLDKASEGLILLTNDGIFAKSLLDPKRPHEREYIVRTEAPLSQRDVLTLEKGVRIGHYVTKPCSINILKSNLFQIILTEGKNRQIRRMIETVGTHVIQLKRIRIGPLTLENLSPEKFQTFDPKIFRCKVGQKH